MVSRFWKPWICHGPNLHSYMIFSTGSALNNDSHGHLWRNAQRKAQSSYPFWDNLAIRQTPRSCIHTRAPKPPGRSVKMDREWACRTLTLGATTFPHLRKPATKDRKLTRWPENTQYLDPGSLEMKNVQAAPLVGTWQTLPSPTLGTLLHL